MGGISSWLPRSSIAFGSAISVALLRYSAVGQYGAAASRITIGPSSCAHGRLKVFVDYSCTRASTFPATPIDIPYLCKRRSCIHPLMYSIDIVSSHHSISENTTQHNTSHHIASHRIASHRITAASNLTPSLSQQMRIDIPIQSHTIRGKAM
ncbi:hypothetical protein EYC80_005323 [Monilinia laxa]|uniref:Uncharacterized protein n=1 Tax=Monilinia laxa TaxID=61186 RepID=A0A5N6KJV4_MONLA|nr:hypothetical protein EYC80_005323 [Monilinia laxa]